MQIFSKLHFSLCILLNINKIQWCNLLHCKTAYIATQKATFHLVIEQSLNSGYS